MSDTAYDWRDHLDEAGDFWVEIPAHILDSDGTLIGPATFEVSASAGGPTGIALAVDLPHPTINCRTAVWFTVDYTQAYAFAFGTATEVTAEPTTAHLPAWSFHDEPQPVDIQITTDPDQHDWVILNLGDAVLSRDHASAAGLAIIAAWNYLVLNDPAHSHRRWL